MTNATKKALHAWAWGLAMALALVSLLWLPAAADDTSRSHQQIDMFNQGSIAYQRYCANCHGSKAKGDGQVARLLKVQPPDLTVLAANNDGEFPAEQVRKTIDGRKGIVAHGMRDMPIWGDVFLEAENGPEAEAEAERKIEELVIYLKLIQED